MNYTEEQLREALAECVIPGSPDVQQIVRRGRRIKRRRRAGLALAGLAAAAAASLGVQHVWVGPVQVAQRPPTTTATASVAPSLPPENTRAAPPAPLIASRSSDTVLAGKTVEFQPLSFFTSYMIVCADPDAWVITRSRGGAVSRCGQQGSFIVSESKRSASPGWLERTQEFEVWVLPADLPVHEPMRPTGPDPYAGCTVARKDVGWCDGKYLMNLLVKMPGVLEKLAEETESQPGAWAVGVYDRADATDPFPKPNATDTVQP
ncbi:hypothetical protein Acor_76910 [Acrocarpospora corrugata]|uniref:Uncharacterized protein n=1 Tax=Acrocarpospora corrugata TaxID=35763 RepID=A0A5M3WES0_9ACTN|nr:hypothetical protein [Acrocarpospora corrugata]GES05623.1 hypothetical protein Acor_76910 [Acrocarpospora corrugata]